MIYKQNTKEYIPENITEHFRIFITGALIRNLKEGSPLPRFYLPVVRPVNRDVYECWIFLLAPFVLIYYISRNVFWSIWRDLLDFSMLLSRWNQIKNLK